jgi:epoxyqueuosine reductase
VAQIGRNGSAYSPRFGSWINVEAWRVDAELPPDTPARECPCPGTCRACLDACPGGALVEPFVMRMDRCVAWLTYSAPHPIRPEQWGRMGPWIYGCDVCQDVCPLNHGKWQDEEDTPWLREVAHYLRPQALADMSQETYEKIVHPLFWYIPAEDLERWHANARRACKASCHQGTAAPG